MKKYTLHSIQKLSITVDEAWDFLSNPRNLQNIMPENMKFAIVSGADLPIHVGQLIQYRVEPIPGYKTNWVSKITQVSKPHSFVDIQLEGPYKLWNHTHKIKKIDEGVIIEDAIEYIIPYGIVGQLLHPIVIKPRLNKIFNSRKRKMELLFGKL